MYTHIFKLKTLNVKHKTPNANVFENFWIVPIQLWSKWNAIPNLPSLLLTWLMSSIEADARGPRSMLHPFQGFQFGVGGDQDTTPASTGLDGGNKWSRLAFVIKDKDSEPSTPKPSTSTGGGRSKLLRLSTTYVKKICYDVRLEGLFSGTFRTS